MAWMSVYEPGGRIPTDAEEIERLSSVLAAARAELAQARQEIGVLRSYGNKDCTAMADAELAKLRGLGEVGK